MLHSRVADLTAGLVSLLLLSAPAAWGQSLCAIADDDHVNDGGWVGPMSQFWCGGCSDCASFVVEVRGASGSYGDASSAQVVALPYTYVKPTVAYQHRVTYAWRSTTYLADGGPKGPPAPEQLFTADLVPPTVPGMPVVSELDGGSFRVTSAPATDDGSGVVYSLSYILHGRGPSFARGALRVGVADLRDDLGPGEWDLELASRDVAGNYGGNQTLPSTIVVVADPAVPPPAAPVVGSTLTRGGTIPFTVSDPADAYHFVAVEEDGGLFAPFGRIAPTGTPPYTVFGWLPRECTFQVKASRIVGGKASGYSAPSAPFRVDLNPPTAPPFAGAARDGGSVVVTWGTSTDSCSGVSHYVLERGSGSVWAPIGGAIPVTQFVDTLPGPGVWQYRVRADDQAQHAGAFTVTAPVVWPAAGVDGGSADGGVSCGGGAAPCGGVCCDWGETCSQGVCTEPDGGAVTCGVGTTDCSGDCVDPLTDDFNCGACDNSCAWDETCSRGVCSVPGGGSDGGSIVPPNSSRKLVVGCDCGSGGPPAGAWLALLVLAAHGRRKARHEVLPPVGVRDRV